MATAMLKIKGLQVNYGGIQAVKGIDLEVAQGELVTLIGANGAGKTTTMKAITGLKPYSAGDIEYMGQSIKGIPAHELLKRGLAMVPEGRGIFARMSIVENMQMGAYLRTDTDGIKADVDRMFGFFPRLKERASQYAGTLSGGEQQMLAMARDHLAPEIAVAGRTVDGPVADHGREDLRSGAGDLGRRHDRAAGRAERASRIAGGEPPLRDGLGSGHDVRRREADAG
jgi:ABC-type Fe3+/spermidine/putrescine transport system ATPase subunit